VADKEEGIYSADEAKQCIENIAVGLTSELTSKYQTRMRDAIASVDMAFLKSNSGNKLPEIVVGRNILETVRNMFSKEGNVLFAVVTSHLSIHEYIIDLLNQKAVKEEEINDLEVNLVEIPTQPNIEIYKLKSKVKAVEIYDQLASLYKQEYEQSLLDQTFQSTRTGIQHILSTEIRRSPRLQARTVSTTSAAIPSYEPVAER
jgi:hypothetical protein